MPAEKPPVTQQNQFGSFSLLSNVKTGGIVPLPRKLRVAYPEAVYHPAALKLRRDKGDEPGQQPGEHFVGGLFPRIAHLWQNLSSPFSRFAPIQIFRVRLAALHPRIFAFNLQTIGGTGMVRLSECRRHGRRHA
jgi:hypothetical protein